VGGRYDGEVKTGVDAGTLVEFDIGGWELSGTLDQLDNAFFPRHGNLTQLGVFLSRESLGADLDYDKLLVETTQAWSRGRNTVTLGARFGSGLGSDIPFFDQFRLGGFLNLSGYARGELQGDLAALATVTDYWQVGRLGSLGSLYVGGALQAGNAWTNDEQPELRDLIYSATLFFGVDTGFSPVYVGWGKAEGGTSEFYLFVGQLQR
jgi:NTE family protein